MKEKTILNEIITYYDLQLHLTPFTKKLIEECVTTFSFQPEILLAIKNKKRKNSFSKIKFDSVDSIFMGSINDHCIQDMYFKYINDSAKIINIVIRRNKKIVEVSPVFEALVYNREEFINQFLNILYIVGAKAKKGIPEKGYTLLFKMKNGIYYHVKYNKKHTDIIRWFMFVYFNYNLNKFDKRISWENKETKLEKLINCSNESKILYTKLKEILDDFDFIYGVMAHLNTQRKVEIFLSRLEQNESACSFMPLDNVIECMNDAHFLYDVSDNFKPKSIKNGKLW